MKKNITINLCGRLFAIDEDAYEMLATYEQSLRNYFRTREGGEEIAEDIEARIAELFDEVKQQGTQAINIGHVREVIHRLGKPEEMDGEAPHSAPEGAADASSYATNGPESRSGAAGGASMAAKRLYRNPADKKLLGVLSGFAAYFGADVLWWRLGFAAVVLMSFGASNFNFLWFLPGRGLYFNIHFWGIALIVAYIILAVLMPVAETPEDRLRMKGKEVNPQNLAEEVANSSPSPRSSYEGGSGCHSCEESATSQMHAAPLSGRKGHGAGSVFSGCFGCIGGFFVALWTVFTTLLRWSIYALGAFVACLSLVGIVTLLAVALNPSGWFEKSGGILVSPEFAAVVPDLKVPFFIFASAALLVLAITSYAIIHSLLNEFRQMPSMPYRQRIALLMVWILGLVACGAAIGYGLPRFIDADEKYSERHWREIDAEWRQRNTHDGIFVQPHEWDFLQAGGWSILNADGCNDRFTAHGEYMTGDRDVRYLDCYDDNHSQRLRVERADTLQPGTYRLTCAARADGTGACIYAIVGDERPLFEEIPATGNVGGDIWEDAETERYLTLMRERNLAARRGADNFSDESVEIPEDVQRIRRANKGKGFGWNQIAIAPIRVDKTVVVRYGLTSDPAFTGRTWLGHWFSATDFVLQRITE